MVDAFMEIAESLGYSDAMLDMSATDFTGPIVGNDADPCKLASICWAFALLTEMFRNPMAAVRGRSNASAAITARRPTSSG
jgi:hypothetical protein